MDSSEDIVHSSELGTGANKIEEGVIADIPATTEDKHDWKQRLAAFSGTFFEW